MGFFAFHFKLTSLARNAKKLSTRRRIPSEDEGGALQKSGKELKKRGGILTTNDESNWGGRVFLLVKSGTRNALQKRCQQEASHKGG